MRKTIICKITYQSSLEYEITRIFDKLIGIKNLESFAKNYNTTAVHFPKAKKSYNEKEIVILILNAILDRESKKGSDLLDSNPDCLDWDLDQWKNKLCEVDFSFREKMKLTQGVN